MVGYLHPRFVEPIHRDFAQQLRKHLSPLLIGSSLQISNLLLDENDKLRLPAFLEPDDKELDPEKMRQVVQILLYEFCSSPLPPFTRLKLFACVFILALLGRKRNQHVHTGAPFGF